MRTGFRSFGLLGTTQATAFAFLRGEGLTGDSVNISNGFSFRSFSPGIGTGYSPVRQPRHMSSRECFSAEMRPRTMQTIGATEDEERSVEEVLQHYPEAERGNG